MTITDIIREFAKWGFTETPLTVAQMEECIRIGLTMDDIYSIGCDMSNGYSYNEALDAVLAELDDYYSKAYAEYVDGIGEGQI